ncbi:hypothetical protein Bca101_060595 [Brassica carinata]
MVSEEPLKPVIVLDEGFTPARSIPIFSSVARKIRSTELPVSINTLVTSYSPISRTTSKGSLCGT